MYVKRFNRNSCKVRGEVAYRSDIGTYKQLTKVGKTMKDFVPEELIKMNQLNENKKRDVDKLLKKHYGEQWREIPELKFYEFVVDNPTQDDDRQDDVLCEQQDEVLNLII